MRLPQRSGWNIIGMRGVLVPNNASLPRKHSTDKEQRFVRPTVVTTTLVRKNGAITVQIHKTLVVRRAGSRLGGGGDQRGGEVGGFQRLLRGQVFRCRRSCNGGGGGSGARQRIRGQPILLLLLQLLLIPEKSSTTIKKRAVAAPKTGWMNCDFCNSRPFRFVPEFFDFFPRSFHWTDSSTILSDAEATGKFDCDRSKITKKNRL